MQLVEYYHRMILELAGGRTPGTAGGGEIRVTLDDLAGILYCSQRNVKIILKKMSDQEWIRWIPGRGRGNRSGIEFRADADKLILGEAQRYVKDGNVKAAMEMINLQGVQTSGKEEFLEWMSGYFGYQETREKEKRMDTLRLPYYSTIQTLDPARILFAKDLHLVKQIFDTLVRFDPKERTIKPHLAHHWESNGEGTLWTFYLRKGVRFHHGKELTADDAAFTLERLKGMEQTATNGWLAGPIREVRVLDRFVLQVRLHAPNYMFLNYASAAGMSVLPMDIYGAGTAHVDRYPVGTGPFRVTRHDDCTCLLDANDDYFLERAHLDRVEIWIMPSDCRPNHDSTAGTELTAVLSSSCEWSAVPAPCPDGLKQVQQLEQGCLLLAFNLLRDGPQRHRGFREAVHRVIDRAAMARDTGNGNLYPAQGFLPEGELSMGDPSYDREAAIRLLKESGYAGEPMLMYLRQQNEAKGRWIQEQLATIGIAAEVRLLSLEDAADVSKLAEADCFYGGVVADEDLDLSLLEMYQIGNMPLRTYFDKGLQAELNRRIAAILQEPEEKERPARIRELEQLLKEDFHVTFLLHMVGRTTFSPTVNGVSLNSLGMVNFKDIWFQPVLPSA